MTYNAPTEDMLAVLRFAADYDQVLQQEAFAECDLDLTRAVLEEAGKFSANVLAPINREGDISGARLEDGEVIAAPGFAEAYGAFREGGWVGLPFSQSYGGQGLPRALALAMIETVHSANMAFGLCPLLSFGAIEALLAHGTKAQQDSYLPKLISGDWTGTMNLTEPQAGSDVGALKTKAAIQADGSYRINGQKIYITWGDHDAAENIIHLVLARLEDAPPGSKGVSLFLVPKFIPDADGNPGARNNLRCIGLEEKLGIHASPTCVMEFGDSNGNGATGWLIGEENKGLACMFTMMNAARLNVGLEGVSIGEAAFQKAYSFACERRQGRADSWHEEGASPIIHHPDIRRMLMLMQAKVMASRAICYSTATAADLTHSASDAELRAKAKGREEWLTPIAKAWSTDLGIEIASMGIQIHGGMGFVEETGAAQFYRDARIGPIYEGTNGIQAIDLVGRKLNLAGGAATADILGEIGDWVVTLQAAEGEFAHIGARLGHALGDLAEATSWMREQLGQNRNLALAGASTYLSMAGDVVGGFYLAKMAYRLSQDPDAKATDLADKMLGLAHVFSIAQLSASSGKLSDIIHNGEHILQMKGFAEAAI